MDFEIQLLKTSPTFNKIIKKLSQKYFFLQKSEVLVILNRNVSLVFWLKMVNINVPKIEFQCCILVLRKKTNLWLIFCNLFSEYGLTFGLFLFREKAFKTIYIPDLVEIGCSALNISPVWTKCLLAPLNTKCCQYNKIICRTSWLKWYPLIPSLIHLLWSHVHESCSPFILQMNAQWPILWNMHLSLQAYFVFLTLHEKNIYLVVLTRCMPRNEHHNNSLQHRVILRFCFVYKQGHLV